MEVPMIEALLLTVALCGTPTDLPQVDAQSAIEGVIPVEATVQDLGRIFGEFVYPIDEPRERPTSEVVLYRVWVDPAYAHLSSCFRDEVVRILSDERSWPDVYEAAPWETPNFHIILAPPWGCEDVRVSCAAGAFGTGEIRVNVLRWVRPFRQPGAVDREHLINHEVGHILGLSHTECMVDGSAVMIPTSKTHVCEFQAWPTETERHLSAINRGVGSLDLTDGS